MNDKSSQDDKRRYPRVALSKDARARLESGDRAGRIRDISASGASLELDEPLAENDPIDLTIDGFGQPISGHVVRALDDGIAVEFELEAAEEEALLREINDLHAATIKTDEF